VLRGRSFGYLSSSAQVMYQVKCWKETRCNVILCEKLSLALLTQLLLLLHATTVWYRSKEVIAGTAVKDWLRAQLWRTAGWWTKRAGPTHRADIEAVA